MVQEADVRSARKKLGLSQEKLAEKLGVSRNTVSRWEKGEVSPSAENMMALNHLFAQLERPAAAEEAPAPKEETVPPSVTHARIKVTRWTIVLACAGLICSLLIGIAALIGIYSINQRLEPDSIIPAEDIEREEVDQSLPGTRQPFLQ